MPKLEQKLQFHCLKNDSKPEKCYLEKTFMLVLKKVKIYKIVQKRH